MPRILFKRRSSDVQAPERGSTKAAGYDLRAHLPSGSSPYVSYGLPGGIDRHSLKTSVENYGQSLLNYIRNDLASKFATSHYSFSSGAGTPTFYVSEPDGGAELERMHYGQTINLEPGFRVLVPTGLYLAIPDGWECQVRPRSGLAKNHGLTVLNAPGTIDSDFRGELHVLLYNAGGEIAEIRHGDRIAQLLAFPTFEMRFEERDELPDTERGEGGFGSTGAS